MTPLFRVWDGARIIVPPHAYLVSGRDNLYIRSKDATIWPAPPEFEALFFTGYTDRDKTRIYEGDILRAYEDTCDPVCSLVEWQRGGFNMTARSPCANPPGIHARKSRVIGNRYEDEALFEEMFTTA